MNHDKKDSESLLRMTACAYTGAHTVIICIWADDVKGFSIALSIQTASRQPLATNYAIGKHYPNQ